MYTVSIEVPPQRHFRKNSTTFVDILISVNKKQDSNPPRLSKESGSSILVRESLCVKALFISLSPSERFTSFRFMQAENAPSSIISTLSGISNSSKLSQPKKAFFPIFFMPLGIVTELIFVQSSKANSPMVSILEDNLTSIESNG